MGIILEKSKLVFDELIGSSSFDEIFKNSIRDYYTYGFKSYEQFSKGSQIVKDRWKIFSKVLGTKWDFEKRKNGRNQIILKTMPCGGENPVDDFYFLHNLSKIGDYLNYLLDLDPKSSLQGGMGTLPVDQEVLLTVEGENGLQKLEDVDTTEHAVIENWLCGRETDEEHADGISRVRINRQLNVWSASTRYMTKSYKDKYSNLGNRTEYLYSLGVIGDLRDAPNKRNEWLRRQWDLYDPKFKKYFTSDTAGDHFWYKSPLTMALICQYGACGKQEEMLRFLEKLRTMCEFFSQYYPLGEIGTLLAARCSGKIGSDTKKVFRFKHNYLQKTLYDYNLIDMLSAIEKKCLCQIRYSHGTNLHSCEEIVIPLEIRISVVNGREYVLYYHVMERRIRALRLEFIDKIVSYSHVSSVKKVRRIVRKSGKKITREEISSEDIKIDDEELEHQMHLAEQMLPYIWGTGVGTCEVRELWREQLISFQMPVSYDSKKEKYIGSRLKKESRYGVRQTEIEMFPTKEVRNWIRSFYSRICEPWNINLDDFSISDDVEAMYQVYFQKQYPVVDEGKEHKKKQDTKYIEEVYVIEGECIPVSSGHEALFNELWSRYAVVLANAVLKCAADHSVNVKQVLRDSIRSAFEYYTSEELEQVAEELETYIKESELTDQNGTSRFIMPECEYLFDVLPITKVEVRWLLTILEDPLSSVFLSPPQIQAVKSAIAKAPFQVGPFEMKKINYFDRYNLEDRILSGRKELTQRGRVNQREREFLKIIYEAMESEKKIRIVYKNWKGEKRYANCAPVWMEYSRRDDIFRIWYVQNERMEIRTINVPRILRIIQLPEKKYDLEEQRELLERILKRTEAHIQVEFYQGKRNLPDRLLTEFSLWRKECIYDVKTKKYTMTLYYSIQDEKEIMIRLLSYGPYIRIAASEDSYILAEIKKRIVRQRELMKERTGNGKTETEPE